MLINKKEIRYYIITIIILSIIFGFDDGAIEFNFLYWLKNFFIVILAVSFSFLLKEAIVRINAKRYGFDYEYDIWKIGRYWFDPESEFKYKRKKIKIPIGIILPLILTLISKGIFYFPVIGTSKLSGNKTKRVGKVFVSGTGIEFAKVYLSGALTYLFLTLVFFNLGEYLDINLMLFVVINLYLAFYSLLPLPGLEGSEILFGSLPLYIFALAFFLATYILMKTSILFTLIFSLFIAFLIVIIYLYRYEQ